MSAWPRGSLTRSCRTWSALLGGPAAALEDRGADEVRDAAGHDPERLAAGVVVGGRDGRGAASARRGAAGHRASLRPESVANGRPFRRDDPVERRVAVRAVGHDRVVAQDALEGRADPEQRRPRRTLRAWVLNSTRSASSVSKAWVSCSSLASRFAPVPLERGPDPGPADLQAPMLGQMVMNRLLPIARPVARSTVANGTSVPAAALASGERDPGPAARLRSVRRAIVQRQTGASKATRARSS